MYRFTLINISTCLIFIFFVAAVTFSGGPPASRTSAPSEGNCTGCHGGTVNSGTGVTTIKVGNNLTEYALSTTYPVEVKIAESGITRFGFQITALDANNQPAGTFFVTDGNATELITNNISGGNRQYIQHVGGGNSPSATGERVWTFNWQAPATDIGVVTFYASTMSSNKNGGTSGDKVYTTSKVLSPQPLATPDFIISASPRLDHIELTWQNPTDVASPIVQTTIESSIDGVHFTNLGTHTLLSNQNSQIYRDFSITSLNHDTEYLHYRIKAQTANGMILESNAVQVFLPEIDQVESNENIYYHQGNIILQNMERIPLTAENHNQYYKNQNIRIIDASGKLIQEEPRNGQNKQMISFQAPKGVYYLQYFKQQKDPRNNKSNCSKSKRDNNRHNYHTVKFMVD